MTAAAGDQGAGVIALACRLEAKGIVMKEPKSASRILHFVRPRPWLGSAWGLGLTLLFVLSNAFPVAAMQIFVKMETGKTKIRDTLVADAAKYCGVVKIQTPIAIGDKNHLLFQSKH